jgi:hypothetical protein
VRNILIVYIIKNIPILVSRDGYAIGGYVLFYEAACLLQAGKSIPIDFLTIQTQHTETPLPEFQP